MNFKAILYGQQNILVTYNGYAEETYSSEYYTIVSKEGNHYNPSLNITIQQQQQSSQSNYLPKCCKFINEIER